MGYTVIFSKNWATRNFEKTNSIFASVAKISLLIGLVFFGLAEFASAPLMNLYTNVPEIAAQGIIYLKAIAPYYLFTAIADLYICFMRNTKAVARGSLFVVISQMVNCICNGFLIFGWLGLPRLGIAGAGISTSISGVLLFVLVLVEYRRTRLLTVEPRHFLHTDRQQLAEYGRLTLPALFQKLNYHVGMNVISALIGHTNADAVSAVAVVSTIYGFLSSLNGATGTVCTLVMSPLMSNKKKNADKLLRYSKYVLAYAAKLGVFLGLLCLLSRLIVPYAFGNITDQSMAYINMLIPMTAVYAFFGSQNNCTNLGMLVPGGDSLAVAIIDLCVIWGVIISSLALGSYVLMLPAGALILFTKLDEMVSFPIKRWRYGTKRWMK